MQNYNQVRCNINDEDDEILTSDDYDYEDHSKDDEDENEYVQRLEDQDDSNLDDEDQDNGIINQPKYKIGKDGRRRNEKGQIVDAEGRTYDDIIKQMGLDKEDKGDGYYCDNDELYKHTLDYCKRRDEALAKGLPKPSVDDYMGMQIMKIATHMSFRPNFLNYSYRQDMINEAIDSCLKYIDSFDPYRSNRIFAYISQICWSTFIRVIKAEKRSSALKGQLMLQNNYDEFLELEDPDDQQLISANRAAAHKYMELAQIEDEKQKKIKEEKDAERQERLNKTNLSSFFE